MLNRNSISLGKTPIHAPGFKIAISFITECDGGERRPGQNPGDTQQKN